MGDRLAIERAQDYIFVLWSQAFGEFAESLGMPAADLDFSPGETLEETMGNIIGQVQGWAEDNLASPKTAGPFSDKTGMTNYERELLVCLSEECAEVIKAASKMLRFGKVGYLGNGVEYPNIVILSGEIGDVMEVIRRAARAELVDLDEIAAGKKRKRARLDKYLQYGPGEVVEDCGPTTVTDEEAGRAVIIAKMRGEEAKRAMGISDEVEN